MGNVGSAVVRDIVTGEYRTKFPAVGTRAIIDGLPYEAAQVDVSEFQVGMRKVLLQDPEYADYVTAPVTRITQYDLDRGDYAGESRYQHHSGELGNIVCGLSHCPGDVMNVWVPIP